MEFIGHETYFFNNAYENFEEVENKIRRSIKDNELTYNNHFKEFTYYLISKYEIIENSYLDDIYYNNQDEFKSYIEVSGQLENVYNQINKKDTRKYFQEFNKK